MQNFILYQAYGSIDHVNECRYSLLKYLEMYNLKPPADIGVIVYTDQPAFFEVFAAFFHYFDIKEISQTQIKEWRGSIDFAKRVKMEILREFLEHTPGNLLYCDADTYFTGPVHSLLSEIRNGTLMMHESLGCLGKLSGPSAQSLKKNITGNPPEYNQKKLVYSDQQELWSAAVIGLNSEHKELLTDTLALTDVVHSQNSRPVTESFAFSYCFQHSGKVLSAAPQVEHYHDLKEFRSLLSIFFKKNEEESIPNLVKLVHHLDAATIRQYKNKFEALPFYKKWLYTLIGKKWSIRQFEKKI